MSARDVPIDEERCLAFESHRLEGGDRPLASFLPDPADAAYAGTLEELVAMELELSWKAWARGDHGSPAPDLDVYADVLAPLAGNGVASRLAEEQQRLRARFTSARPVEPGVRVARYVLRERVGRGAHGEVWRATDETLSRDVAVKLPRPELADDPIVVARLLREAKSAARLRHPGIVPVHEAGEWEGRPYVVSDFVDGETLAAAMRRRRFAPDEAAALVLRIAEALDYAHACGVVHRDVKPGNVLLDAEGRPLVADFGIAQLRTGGAALTRAGDVLGTPAYMAPEQVRGGAAEPDPRTDVYGLGVVLYELLSGSVPFDGTTAESVLYAVVHEDPVPLATRRPGLPRDLETICLCAMAKERERRYPSARALAEDLRRHLDHLPIQARPVGPWGRARLWVRRNPALAGTIAASVTALATVGALAFARVTQERDRAQAHLSSALATQADSLIRVRDSEWFDRAMTALEGAAAVDPELRDTRLLRDLVLRCHSSVYPSFRRVGLWDAVGGSVVSLDVDPAGRRAAAATRDGVVWIRDVSSGDVVARTTLAAASPQCLVFLHGAALLAVGCADGTVRILDATSLAERGVMRGEGAVTALASSSRDLRLAVGREGGGIDVLRVGEDGAAVEREAELAGHPGGTFALDWTPDATRVASGGADSRLRVWDVAVGRAFIDVAVQNAPRSLDVDVKGQFVTWCALENAGWGLVPLAAPETAQTWNGAHLGSVGWIGVDARGRVFTASTDGTIRIWTDNGTPGGIARGSATTPVTAAALVPGSTRLLAAYGDGGILVWDLATPAGCEVFSGPHTARFVPGSRTLAVGVGTFEVDARGRVTGSQRAYGRDAIGSHIAHLVAGAGRSQEWGLAASPDGRHVAVGAHDGSVRLFTLGVEAPRVLRASGPLAWACAFSPDGTRVVACCEGEVVAWDTADGREVARAPLGERLAVSAAFHPALPRVVVATLDGELRVLASEDLAPLGHLHRFDGRIHEAVFSPDGRTLAVACDDGSAVLWTDVARRLAEISVVERKPDVRVDGGGGRMWAVAFDPPGRLLATGTDHGIVTLRDALTYESLATLEGDVRAIRSLSFDDAGASLAAGCYDGPSFLWHLPTLRSVLASMDLDWQDAR